MRKEYAYAEIFGKRTENRTADREFKESLSECQAVPGGIYWYQDRRQERV